jgi:hypothetical protein
VNSKLATVPGRPCYRVFMRASIIHVLVALLIVVFAVGEPVSAKADCRTCEGCPIEAPVKNDAPCQDKAFACQVSQGCASQTQKAPAQFGVGNRDDAREATFGSSSTIAVKTAYLTPETAPPRL